MTSPSVTASVGGPMTRTMMGEAGCTVRPVYRAGELQAS